MISESNRIEWIEKNVNSVGHESFPDDEEVQWKALSIKHESSLSFVEAVAEPASVGYAKFGFVFDFSVEATPELLACYVNNDTKWSLLFDSGSSNTPAWR